MSRIEAWECFTLDVEWYAVDRSGNIAVFLSAGNGNLPESVCADYDKLDSIATYFDVLPKNTESILHFQSTAKAEQVAMDFSDKGLYYFDADLNHFYTKRSSPKKPLKFGILPPHIKQLLLDNVLDFDFASSNTIEVAHAYES
jgi:hypothetical protein